MSTAQAQPRVVRHSPGRARVHLPGLSGTSAGEVERRLLALSAVRVARANPVTGNVLVEFDEGGTDMDAVMAAARRAARAAGRRRAGAPRRVGAAAAREAGTPPPQSPPPAAEPREAGAPVLHEREGVVGRARIAVRGLDRDADLARRVVRVLRGRSGITRVSASRLTGRVLVEFDERRVDIEELLSLVSRVELPELPGEDDPAHPLDPVPLIQSAARTTGAALGLGLLAMRRATGATGAPTSSSIPAMVAAAVGALEGIPPMRRGIRDRLGRDRAELAFGAVSVISLTFAGSPLGLAVTGASAATMLTEVRSRRSAWRAYEERLANAPEAVPGETIKLRAGDRAPLAGKVLEGSGTMIGRDGLPRPLSPGDVVQGGARLCGGPFMVELHGDRPFDPEPRPAPLPPTRLDRYLNALSPGALAYAGLTAVVTRSPSRTLTALLLVNARSALIGADAASSAACTRIIRSGVTTVSGRPARGLRVPDVLLIDGSRVLSDRRMELAHVSSVRADLDADEVLSLAAAVAAAGGSPWGPGFPVAGRADAHDGHFEGDAAFARVGAGAWRLGPVEDGGRSMPEVARQHRRGHYVLVLSRQDEAGRMVPVGVVALRPRLAPGAHRLISACRDRGVRVEVVGDPDSPALAGRAGVPLVRGELCELVRERQRAGQVVALVTDSPHAAPALAAADMSMAFTSGRSGRFTARAEMLVPDLDALRTVIEAASRRRAAVDDAIALSVLANAFGAVWGLRSQPGIERGAHATYVAALGAIGLARLRLAGGKASRGATARLADPQPERWGRPSLEEVFETVRSRPEGLTQEEGEQRAVPAAQDSAPNPLLAELRDQVRSPLNAALMAGAGVSLMFGAYADVPLIAAVIAANAAVGAWQEHQAGQAAELLARETETSVDVIRDGRPVSVRSHEVVPGDVIVLGPGDRVPADARLISSESLEVDEAALTGESLPVSKAADDPSDGGKVVLEGSDVMVGHATAVVFAVREQTRMGATAAALALVEPEGAALDARLNRLMAQGLPVAAAGGLLVTLAGLIWGRPLTSQLALGATAVTAAVPEGLPLLAGVAQAAVARRLAGRNALVRRLSAVEALGRVDVACTDKTGTLTTGRLEVTAIETFDDAPPSGRAGALRDVLLTAALASPRPDSPDAAAHPTDAAVLRAARDSGLLDELEGERTAEAPFEPARAFHATLGDGQLAVKGAAEALVPRCAWVYHRGGRVALDERRAASLLRRADDLAARGLRVLMVARAEPAGSVEDPRGLVAAGLVGISDPLREGVADAVARCQEAGVRVIMLTGDHPETARAIAEQAGLPTAPENLLTGPELAALGDEELTDRLERVSVIARINPLVKLQVVERLQAAGHTVAMTGDGVNDAPALRLADVGVAMGEHGTEVARQASDVVLADDDFTTLGETLVEGRSFWLNLRRSLGLLLGGNVGELGLMAGAAIIGLETPLTTRQLLAVNLVTDVLPAAAIAMQQPENRDLAALRREGERELEVQLRSDIVRRGWATGLPSLAAYVLAARLAGAAQARSVAFAAVVGAQLAQTISMGRAQGTLTRPVLGAIAATGGFTVAACTLPPLAGFLGLAVPGPAGMTLVVGATLLSVALASGSLDNGWPLALPGWPSRVRLPVPARSG